MKKEMNLPFKVGQLVEARTFEEGFRGAWFRCKIREINKKKGKLGHLLEYSDFTEEKLDWTMLYQVAFQYEGNMKGKQRELMVRPPYPPIYNEKQMPRASEITEVTVIGGDHWRVGDLVDWWNSDCYWSGRITQLLGDDEAQIDLTPPPLGEGSSYKALLKDLRPSLDWSPELGWTVPTQEDDTGHPCARIVKPVNQDAAKSRTETETGACSLGKTVSKKRKHKQERSTRPGPTDSSTEKPSMVVADSGHNGPDPAAAVSDATKSRTSTETLACFLRKTISKKRKHKQERSTRPEPADSSTRKPSGVVADSCHNGADLAAAVSDAAKSRTSTETPTCSLGKKVSKKRKHKQERSTRPGPTDSSTGKPSMVVADSGHNGPDPAAAVSDAAKSRTVTETPACSLGKTVSKKRKHKQERSTRPGPADSSTGKPSMVVADSGHNGPDPAAAVSDAAKSRTAATETPACSLRKTISQKWKHKQKRSPRVGPADRSTGKPGRVVADSGHNGPDPAAEIARGELNPENGQEKNGAGGRIDLLSKGSELIEAAILDLEEYVNKVKWLKKLLQYGISSSDAQVPQWEFVEEIP